MKKIDWRKRLRRLEFNFRRHPITLVGDEGRPYRKALLILCGLLLVLLLALFSREEPQLMASPEVAGIQDRAVLRVGIRSDIPDLGGLEQALAQIDGVGEVRVVLTLQSGPRRILAQDSQSTVDEGRTEAEVTNVVISAGSGVEGTVTLQQLSPQFQGALVVCSGGGEPTVQLRLVEAVSALTGLGADKISVCKGK